MVSIQEPEDLISISLYNIFSKRKDEKAFKKLVHNWNKKIVIHLEPFYPVTIIFEGDNILFERGEPETPDLKVKMHINAMLDMAYDRINPFFAMEEGHMVIEGLGQDSSKLTKFYNIFMVSLQKAAQQENQNYYELNKKTR